MALTKSLTHLSVTLSVATITQSVANLRAGLSRYADYRRSCDELNKLTQRDLEDLGISRWDIPKIAHESVYGRR